MDMIKQEMEIFGTLHVGDHEYKLLSPEPIKPDKIAWVQSGVLKFFVVNAMGHACYVYVSGDFYIDTMVYKKTNEIWFYVDKEEEPVKISVSDTVQISD